MTPEAAHYLEVAHQHIAKERGFLAILHYPDEAARAAYLAGFNAAQALVITRNGRIAKTHRGLRTVFSQLAQNEARLDADFTRFLGRAFQSKARADYGMEADAPDVTEAEAREMIETAVDLIARIEEILT